MKQPILILAMFVAILCWRALSMQPTPPRTADGVRLGSLVEGLGESAVEALHALWLQIKTYGRLAVHRRAVRRRLAWRHRLRNLTAPSFRRLLVAGTVLSRGTVGDKRIALTLDDGPSSLTPQTLAILARHRVPATFFLVGRQAARYPQYVRLIREAGHEIENHTWSHELGWPYTPTSFTSSTLAHQLDEIRRTDRKLSERTRFLRVPGGLFGPCWGTVQAARGLCKVIVNWDVDGDTPGWQHVAHGRIVGMQQRDLLLKYERRVIDGSIILMHPENATYAPYTLKILDRFIADLLRKGYRFVTLDELVF